MPVTLEVIKYEESLLQQSLSLIYGEKVAVSESSQGMR